MHDLSFDGFFYNCFVGAFKIPSVNVPRKVENTAWGIFRTAEAYHASSDTSLFSSSLPVLPHEKCTSQLFYKVRGYLYL